MKKQKLTWNKILFLLLFSGSLPFSLQAARESRIVTAEGKVIQTSSITIRKEGVLEYLAPDGKTKMQIPRERYLYAWSPKPADITQADQQYKNGKYDLAAALYRKCGDVFKLLGWGPYCVRMEASCLAKTGKKPEAAKLLLELRKTRVLNQETQEELNLANDLLCDLLIDSRQYNQAKYILKKQLTLDQKDLVFSALFKMAVILQNTGKQLDAARMFYHTALLFPGHERRPEALYNAWNLFTERKDPMGAKIAQMLKKQYPDDPNTKRIFL